MIPNDPEERAKVISYMIKACEDHTEEMTPWERNFIISISNQFDRVGTLSREQGNKLEQIYDKF